LRSDSRLSQNSALAATVPDEKLPMKNFSALLDRVAKDEVVIFTGAPKSR